MVDLDDTSRCHQADACESCGGDGTLIVATANTPLGVVCVTSCKPCVLESRGPRWSAVQAAERVYKHCVDLGIDLDTMAELMEAPAVDDGDFGL